MAKYCTNCGKEINEGADICLNCGKIVNKNINSYNPNAKNKVIAGLFGIFLGCFGIHNFYLGYTKKALAQLLITVLSCFTLSFISYIWGLIEGILILCGNINCDANGNPLSD